MKKATVANIKRALAHANTEQLGEIGMYIKERLPEAKWNELRDLKVGDKVYTHQSNSDMFTRTLQVLQVRPRRKTLVIGRVGAVVTRRRNGSIFGYGVFEWDGADLLRFMVHRTPHPDAITRILTAGEKRGE